MTGMMQLVSMIERKNSGMSDAMEPNRGRSARAAVPPLSEPAGFTLLEVMIAVAVLGIAMLSLLSLHDSNLQGVMRGKELSTASVLAQGLMTNAEMERVPRIGITSGDFQRLFAGAYRNFKWERTVEMSAMFPDVRKVQVTVFYGPRWGKHFSLVEFLHDPTPQLLPGQPAPGGNPGGQPAPRRPLQGLNHQAPLGGDAIAHS